MNNRRNFLKGSILSAGALALNPYMNPLFASTKSATGPCRFIFIRKCNGLIPKELALPTFSNQDKKRDEDKMPLEVALDKHELPNWLKGLNEYKDNMTILQGLSAKMSENGHSSFQSVMGCFKSKKDTLSALKRTTVDFELAKLFPSPFKHIELSYARIKRSYSGINPGYAVPAPYQRNFCYADARTAYNNIFKSVLKPASVVSDNGMLSYLRDFEERNPGNFSGSDRDEIEQYVESIHTVQERNKKLLKMSKNVRQHMPKLGELKTTVEDQTAMTDILAASLITGLTNVALLTIDDLGCEYTGLPSLGTSNVVLHALGHNKSFNGLTGTQVREEVRKHHTGLIKRLIEKLKTQPEGNGTMFDNTMIMYFPEGGEKHHGTGTESPFVILSGKNCKLDIAGRYIRLPYLGAVGHKTLGNWYTTLLNAHGNPIHHYGDLDATMSRKKLPQEGAIKNFMRS